MPDTGRVAGDLVEGAHVQPYVLSTNATQKLPLPCLSVQNPPAVLWVDSHCRWTRHADHQAKYLTYAG